MVKFTSDSGGRQENENVHRRVDQKRVDSNLDRVHFRDLLGDAVGPENEPLKHISRVSPMR